MGTADGEAGKQEEVHSGLQGGVQGGQGGGDSGRLGPHRMGTEGGEVRGKEAGMC